MKKEEMMTLRSISILCELQQNKYLFRFEINLVKFANSGIHLGKIGSKYIMCALEDKRIFSFL
jgi:hypothetical protein